MLLAKTKKSVVIVESPAKARTISRFLGAGYYVAASMGHVRDLPSSKMGIDPSKGFEASYRVIPTRRKVVKELLEQVKKAEFVYLAPDPDREGEAIAWHLKEALKVSDAKCRRVTFHEITRRAIEAAFAETTQIDMDKVNAQQARRFLDRLVGYELSPLLWRKVAKGLSAGRVQSVAVRLIVEREREIQAFKPEEFWRLTATLAPEGKGKKKADRFQAELARLDDKKAKVANEEQARGLVEELHGAGYSVSKLDEKTRRDAPPPPFITSTLQQQASIQLRYSAKRTMRLAQQLYEGVDSGADGGGLITYMRTDSVHVADEAVQACRAFIGETYAGCLPEEPRRYKAGKRAQEAHEAVRPTSMENTPERMKEILNRDQTRLYELIWKRFVASQMKPAEWAVTDVEVTAGRAVFKTQGKRLLFDGHLRVGATKAQHKDELLPELADGAPLDLVELEPTQHFTQPPPRYSEATLVKTLEKEGIGRPSTYAPIITAIQDRGYVAQQDRRFNATELGMLVTDLLVEHFAKVMDVTFTSRMEEDLDQVEEGNRDWRAVLEEFYAPFKQDLDAAQEQMAQVKNEPEPTGKTCPLCKAGLVVRWSKHGKFFGCSKYPECQYTQPADENGEAPEPVKSDQACPTCGKPMISKPARGGVRYVCTGAPDCLTVMKPDKDDKLFVAAERSPYECEKCGSPMLYRTGSRGKFLACSGFPKCRNTKSVDAEGKPVEPEKVGIACDKCGEQMVVKSSRRGPFLSCSAFPKCRNAKPLPPELKEKYKEEIAKEQEKYAHIKVEVACEECGSPMRIKAGRRGPFLACTAYPKCKTTQPLPDDLADQIDG